MSQIIELISKISEEAGALAPTNSGGVPFKFRGVDATINHLAPILNKYGVIVVPRVIDRATSQREIFDKSGSATGKVVTQTDLLTEFTFYAPDGSSVTATTTGLAQDFSDRSAAQAQSVAFRVALLQTFHLPTDEKEPEERGEEVLRGITEANAAQPAKVKAAPPAQDTVDSVRQQIIMAIGDESIVSKDRLNEIGDMVTKKPRDEWFHSVAQLKKVLEAVNKEIAEKGK